ncbi:MAG: PKD domain-containing protein [Planctomycetia bacterium]|nr:PKD domain-containing protein [Planctomycetia bacterium]
MSRKKQQQSLSWKPVIEVLEDRYVMDAWGLALDFGTPTSPVDQLFDQYGTDVFTADKGKGWASANGLQAYDTGVGTDLTRDGVRAKRNTFVMKVPNGTYKVTATLGDGITVSDRISIYVNGTKVVNSFTNTKEQITKISFSAKITKGELRLTFADEGGKNQYFSLADLEVQQVVKPNVKPLVASIEAPSVLDEGTQAVFNAKVTGGKGPYKYSWNFGDGSATSSSANPAYTFKDNGTYKVQLSVKDAIGKIVRHTTEIVVNNVAPNATIGASNKDSRDNTFTFNSIVNDPSLVDQQAGFTYRWNFGDGGTSQLANPSHAFSAPGTYTVALVVADKDGGSSTSTTTVQIDGNSTLTASIVPSVANPSEGQPVNFTAQVSGGVAPYTYVWNLNGQEATYSSSYNYTFDDNGSRTISLTVTDKNQVSTTVQLPVNISNVAPTAIFTGTVTGAADRNTSPTGSVVFQNATDISAADRAAGFRYSFDFNKDGIFEVVDSTSATAQVPGSYLLPGNNTVRGRIKDKDNGFTDYNAVLVIPGTGGDTQAPTVNLTTPTPQSTVTGVIQIAALATDNVGVVGVRFLLDNQQIGAEVTSAPFTMSWNSAQVGNGTHTLKAIARDAAGNTTTSAVVQFTVNNVTSVDTTAPTVNLTSPAPGSTVSGIVNITANASDNVGVVGVQFLLNNQPLGAVDTSAPYSFSWNSSQVSNGTHTLSAVARDAAGNTTTASVVQVTVNNQTDTVAPTITLTSPTHLSTVTGTINIVANASDNIGVTGVQFMLNNQPLGVMQTSGNYTYSWNTALVTNGTHMLTAVARDAAGNTTTAGTVIVTVSNPVDDDPINKPLLNQGDFTYLGSFNLPRSANGWSSAYTTGGLTHRYVNGNLQFLTTSHVYSGGLVYEFNYPGIAQGTTLPRATVVRNWGDVYTGNKWVGNDGGTSQISAGAPTYGLYYDQNLGRLYWNYGHWYNATHPNNPSMGYSILNDTTGIATGVGAWRLENRPEKFSRGGTLRIPQWFADEYTDGKSLGVGFGGYFSIISSGSFGPSLAAVNDPDINANPNRSALENTPLAGYPHGAPARGERNPNYYSTYDGGAWNPENGVGHWTWSDIIYGSATWIDNSNYGGLLYLAKTGTGNVYYQNSDRHASGFVYEWMIYNPKDLADVASGIKQQWEIQPQYRWVDNVLPSSQNPWSGDGLSQVGGVTFDSTTNRLYVLVNAVDRDLYESFPRMYVYQVGSITAPSGISETVPENVMQPEKAVQADASLVNSLVKPVEQTKVQHRFQFGLSDAPTVEGYQKVSKTSTFSTDVGFGWLTKDLWNVKNGSGDSFATQGLGTSNGTFAVNLPNGEYRVTIRLGHPTQALSKMGVYLQGSKVLEANTAAGQSTPRTFSVKVHDGKLMLKLANLSSTTKNVVIQSLDIVSK